MTQGITSRHVRSAIAIVIIAAAAWVLRGFLLTFLIEPIGWLLWAGWRILASIDRSLIWLIILIASSLMIIRLVPPDLVSGEGDHAESRQAGDPGDRLAHWRTWAARSMTGAAGTSALRATLESMAVAVADVTRRPPPPPPDAGDQASRGQAGMVRLGDRLSRILPDHRRRSDARRVDHLLNWMEASLEIKDEQ